MLLPSGLLLLICPARALAGAFEDVAVAFDRHEPGTAPQLAWPLAEADAAAVAAVLGRLSRRMSPGELNRGRKLVADTASR